MDKTNLKEKEFEAKLAWKENPVVFNKQTNTQTPKLTQEVKSFCSETTAHGFGNIVKDNTHLLYKITWSIVVTTALIGSVLHLSSVVQIYLTYPSQESTKLSVQSPSFPYVTLCNLDPWSVNGSLAFLGNNETRIGQYVDDVNSITPMLDAIEHSTGLDLKSAMFAPSGLYANAPADELQRMGHQMNNFILRCTYMNRLCEPDDWVHILHPDYFNCYTFIGGERSGEAPSGTDDALSLILWMENDENLFGLEYNIYSNIGNSWGARVDIHDYGTFPLPEITGIDISPGYSTSIVLKETTIKKLPQPWGSCTNRARLPDFNQYKYSAKSCMTICGKHFVYEKCGCVDYPVTNSLTNQPFCVYYEDTNVNLTEFTDKLYCAYDAQKKFYSSKEEKRKCQCDEACHYRTYDKRLSQSVWPAKPYQFDLVEKILMNRYDRESLLAYQYVNPIYGDVLTDDVIRDYFSSMIKSTTARVNIYFEDMQVLERTQTASMQLTDLFANVGGTMGLWAGLSIVTFIEVVFLLVKLCAIGVAKCKKQNSVRKLSGMLKPTAIKN